jgi:glycosyltransferase involved in cell wall biosynthesis
MNVGLDLRPSLSRPTGVGTYVASLARRLPALAPHDSFVYFSASLRQRYPAVDWPANVRLVDRRIPVRLLNLAWNRLGRPSLARLAGVPLDLVHSPHPLLVPGGRRARHVVTVCDLFFLKHREQTGAEIRRDYAPLAAAHVRRADGVICISAFTAAEAQRLLGVEPAKLAVIPLGVEPFWREAVPEADVAGCLARHGLARGFVLYLGSAEPRKNLPRLMEAHRDLATRRAGTPPLVLLGPDDAWSRPGPPPVRALGWLPAAEARALMAAAALLVLPSLEEGFGLTVAEAMAAGVPVVCSRGSALDEVAEGAAERVDPLDPRSIGDGLERVLDDQAHAEALRRRGLERSRAFDWDQAARQTLDFYRRVAAAPPPSS